MRVQSEPLVSILCQVQLVLGQYKDKIFGERFFTLVGKRENYAALQFGFRFPGLCKTSTMSFNTCQFNDTAYVNGTCNPMSSFMTTLQILIMSRCDIADSCKRIGQDEVPLGDWYDFIIVGAGVAGPVIAKRLSDNPAWRVLLIEAGPQEPSLSSVPALANFVLNTSLDWQYETEPTQPNPTACLENGGKCRWPRGKMVSGTGGMNGMMYVRGHPDVYDTWSRAGNPGWSFTEIRPYFERAENPLFNNMVDDQPFPLTKHPGPVHLRYFDDKPKFADDVLEAAREMGYQTGPRFGYNHTGFMVAAMMVDNGLRGTTSRFYTSDFQGVKKNLKVVTNARVTKVLVDKWTEKAYGVEMIDSMGEKHLMKSNLEVILSAGTIGSAQILLQSGIGPKKDLEKLRIKVLKDLPVGKNLVNHVSVGVKMSIKDANLKSTTLDALNEFVMNRTGPLANTGLTQMTGFMETKYAKPGVPDIQVFFDGFNVGCSNTGLERECENGSMGPCPHRREITLRPTALLTKSRGYMKLRSQNPIDSPLLYPNYFTDDFDMKVLIEGIKKVIAFTNTSAMRRWDLKLDEEPEPWCSGYHFGTDAYWECVIRTKTGAENHQAGTCKMGPASDPESVVDSKLNVHGLGNLRVADASIMPFPPNSNPTAAVIMIAEKVSDIVYQKWSRN